MLQQVWMCQLSVPEHVSVKVSTRGQSQQMLHAFDFLLYKSCSLLICYLRVSLQAKNITVAYRNKCNMVMSMLLALSEICVNEIIMMTAAYIKYEYLCPGQSNACAL